MKSLVCLAILTVLACVASVPYEHSVERARRSNPLDFFNKNTNTKKVVKKKSKPQPKPKPTTQTVTTTSAPTVTTTSPTFGMAVYKNKMPDYIARKMGKLTTEDQVQRFLGITKAMSQKISLSKKTLPGGGSLGSSSANNLAWTQSIYCLPRPQVIPFPQPNLYHGVIYPLCAMALRCGGCCHVDMHHCVPDQVGNQNHSVFYIPYNMVSSQGLLPKSSNGNSRKKRSSGQIEARQIAVENHLTCQCQCKVRPEHCDSKRQYHDESTCQCKCKDDFTESSLKCADPFRYDEDTCSCKCAYHHKHCPVAKQHWDNKQCKCICDSGIRCPMGQVINKNTCECEDIQMSDKQ